MGISFMAITSIDKMFMGTIFMGIVFMNLTMGITRGFSYHVTLVSLTAYTKHLGTFQTSVLQLGSPVRPSCHPKPGLWVSSSLRSSKRSSLAYAAHQTHAFVWDKNL